MQLLQKLFFTLRARNQNVCVFFLIVIDCINIIRQNYRNGFLESKNKTKKNHKKIAQCETKHGATSVLN